MMQDSDAPYGLLSWQSPRRHFGLTHARPKPMEAQRFEDEMVRLLRTTQRERLTKGDDGEVLATPVDPAEDATRNR